MQNQDFICRQAVVRNSGLSPYEIGSRFSRCLLQQNAELGFMRNQFGRYGRAEILRRIVLILGLNFEKNDATWNSVLGVQIKCFIESYILFDGLDKY